MSPASTQILEPRRPLGWCFHALLTVTSNPPGPTMPAALLRRHYVRSPKVAITPDGVGNSHSEGLVMDVRRGIHRCRPRVLWEDDGGLLEPRQGTAGRAASSIRIPADDPSPGHDWRASRPAAATNEELRTWRARTHSRFHQMAKPSRCRETTSTYPSTDAWSDSSRTPAVRARKSSSSWAWVSWGRSWRPSWPTPRTATASPPSSSSAASGPAPAATGRSPCSAGDSHRSRPRIRRWTAWSSGA